MALQISKHLEQVVKTYNGDFNTIKKVIYDYNLKNSNKISFKLKDKTMLVYNDFVKNPTKDDLFNNSRSIVLNSTDDSYKIVAYTHPIIDYNNSSKMEELTDKQFVECYEGTLLSVYFSNDKWNYSTRKCVDSKDSYWSYNGKVSEKSHYDMFLETVGDVSVFESKLQKDKSYYFVLVHHENKIFVDYTDKFGSEYKKLFLLFVRDVDLNLVDSMIDEYNGNKEVYTFEQVKENIANSHMMGYLYNDNGQFYVYHTDFYTGLEKAAPYASSYECMLVELYKRNNLDEHFKQFPENLKYRTSVFDTKGMMYGVFTYLSMSLLNLYYYFTMFDGQKLTQRNVDDFKVLFDDKNYTLHSMLFKMKGIVLSKKKKLELDDVKKLLKYYINSNDIIRCLKEYEMMKTSNAPLFKKMNPKYNDNAILKEFVSNL